MEVSSKIGVPIKLIQLNMLKTLRKHSYVDGLYHRLNGFSMIFPMNFAKTDNGGSTPSTICSSDTDLHHNPGQPEKRRGRHGMCARTAEVWGLSGVEPSHE